jgi:rhomboid protease GluP
MDSGRAEESSVPKASVRLSPSFWRSLRASTRNPMGLRGNGEVLLVDGELLIRELRSERAGPWVKAAREVRIRLDRIENVRASGGDLQFEVKGEESLWTLYFKEDSDDAVAWLERLPKAQTDDYRDVLQDVTEFERLLDATTPRHFVALAFVALNVAVFAAMAVFGAGVVAPVPIEHIRWGSNAAPFTMGGEGWRLVTSQFIHFGLMHLLLNVFVLASNGPLVERMLGPIRFTLLYLLSGATGAAASAFWNPAVNSAGASGAIFGMFGLLLAMSLRPGLGIPRSVLAQQRSMAVGFIAANVLIGFQHPNVDNAAHVGGMVGGFVLGFLLPRSLGPTDPRLDSRMGTVGASVASIALVGLVALPVLQPNPTLAAEQALRRANLWFAMNDPAAIAELRGALLDVQSGDPVRAVKAQRVEPRIDSFWSGAAARVIALQPVTDATLEARRQILRQYVRLRRAQVEALQEALLGDADSALKRAGSISRDIDTLLRSAAAPLADEPRATAEASDFEERFGSFGEVDEFRAALRDAEQALDAGNLDDALARAEALSISAPQAQEPHLLRADVLIERGDRDAALAAYAAARSLAPLDPMAGYRYGNLALTAAKYREAEEILTEVLRIAPRHVEALADRAVARNEQRNLVGALQDARAACARELKYGCDLVRQFEP